MSFDDGQDGWDVSGRAVPYHGPNDSMDLMDVAEVRGFIHPKAADMHRAVIAQEIARLRAELMIEIRNAYGCRCENCGEQ